MHGIVLAFHKNNRKGRHTMPDRTDEIRYLRQKARQFRELAGAYQTEISPLLLEIAVELELRADAIEKGQEKNK